MDLSLTADQPGEGRRWGSVWVAKVKKYIRRRPVVKYTLFGIGFVFCLILLLLLYLGVAGDAGEDEGGSETLLAPAGRHPSKLLHSELLAQEPASRQRAVSLNVDRH